MTPEQLDQCKQKILLLSEELEASAAASLQTDDTGTVTLDQQSVGRLSRIDAMQAQQMAMESKRRRELQRKQVFYALQRVETDQYGVCARCEDDIDPKRLLFNPLATLCLACANGEND